jgi:hypothetical protein
MLLLMLLLLLHVWTLLFLIFDLLECELNQASEFLFVVCRSVVERLPSASACLPDFTLVFYSGGQITMQNRA